MAPGFPPHRATAGLSPTPALHASFLLQVSGTCLKPLFPMEKCGRAQAWTDRATPSNVVWHGYAEEFRENGERQVSRCRRLLAPGSLRDGPLSCPMAAFLLPGGRSRTALSQVPTIWLDWCTRTFLVGQGPLEVSFFVFVFFFFVLFLFL